MVEVREQCKGCFHFQVCADVMKNQLFIREKVCMEENPQCEHYSPTADVVEVVRCKDCKYVKPMSFKGYFMCKRHHKYCRKADDFCSYGERKGGEQE